MSVRKAGRCATDEQRDSWKITKIISQLRQFVRSDYGGKSHGVEGDTEEAKKERAIRSISESVKSFFDGKGKSLTDEGIRYAAEFSYEFNQEQLAGTRKRIENPIRGLERRLEKHSSILKGISKSCDPDTAKKILDALHDLEEGMTEKQPLF